MPASRIALLGGCPRRNVQLRDLFQEHGYGTATYGSTRELLDSLDLDNVAILATVATERELVPAAELPFQLWEDGLATPVLVLAELTEPQWITAAWRMGAADVLVAPVDHRTLVARVLDTSRRFDPLRMAWAEWQQIAPRLARLTPRERLILDRLAAGAWIKRIASELGTSPNTVRKQRGLLMEKLEVGSLAELIALALNARWLGTFAALRHRPPSGGPGSNNG